MPPRWLASSWWSAAKTDPLGFVTGAGSTRSRSVVRLDLAYDGTDFRGFARQPGQRTIEGELRAVLEDMYEGRISVGGRTDAGVHAQGQVISLHTSLEPSRLQRAVNLGLGPEIAVTRAGRAPEGFDARTSATARAYRYTIDVGEIADPFTARFVWHRPLAACSLRRMRHAASLLVGHRDFSSFGVPPVRRGDPFRRLDSLAVSRVGDLVHVAVRGNAFLRQMVRGLVGTVLEVGAGGLDPGVVAEILTARDRNVAPQMAPAHGLTLERVVYGRGLHHL